MIDSLRRLHKVALVAPGILYNNRFYHGYHVMKSAAVLVEPLPSPGLGYRAQGKQHGVTSISAVLLPADVFVAQDVLGPPCFYGLATSALVRLNQRPVICGNEVTVSWEPCLGTPCCA